MPILGNFPGGGPSSKNAVTIPYGGSIALAESLGLGLGPYTIEVDEESSTGGAASKEYVDGLVGDIASALRAINGEVAE